MKIRKRMTAFIVSLMAVLLLLTGGALAAGSIDTEREVQLTVSCQDVKTALSGAEFAVYQIAAVEENGDLTPLAPFDRFNVDIRGKNDEAWKALASTLEGYVLRDQIAPAASGRTDGQGLLRFSGLEQGLYLMLGSRHSQNGQIYDAAPVMVLLPAREKETDEWIYDVTVNPKFDSHPEPDENIITRKVLKVWEDEGHEKKRPRKISIQLLRDGKVYDTVTLSASNDWRYAWEELEDAHTWTVVEKDVKDYTVTVTREGVTFVVTNTYDGEEPTPPPAKPGKPGGSKLPQTGQLWWPVPVLLAGGLLLIILGLLRRRRAQNEE